MTREQKLSCHLEAIIWEDSAEGETMSAAEIEAKMASATTQQRRRAYARGLVRSPVLLEGERNDK
jgi:hypothetical protein